MAIQLPNPGLGDGQTGDNEFVMWTKVKDNFNNNSHAASRLVGEERGNVIQVEGFGIGSKGGGPVMSHEGIDTPVTDKYGNGFYIADAASTSQTLSSLINVTYHTGYPSWQLALRRHSKDLTFRYTTSTEAAVFESAIIYHTNNTTKEADTGYLIASSPVLKVQHDSFERVHEAEQLDIDVQHVETGVYEITGTTGLRDNDGWHLKPPKDINGNVLCICEATQDGDVITLNTYKKKFDFETVSIVADYEQPADIPSGATVMLRFNDLPDEPMPPEV